MKRIDLHVTCLVLSSICLSTVSASAEESFFHKLNPFRKKESRAVRVEISDTKTSSSSFPRWKPMKMPWSGPSFKFTPTWVSNSIKPPSFSAAWTRMNRSSVGFYNTSKTFFMPWTKTSIKQPPAMRPPTGSRGVYRAIPKNSDPPKKKWFFPSFFSSKPDAPSRNRTVGEFLSQERPKP